MRARQRLAHLRRNALGRRARRRHPSVGTSLAVSLRPRGEKIAVGEEGEARAGVETVARQVASRIVVRFACSRGCAVVRVGSRGGDAARRLRWGRRQRAGGRRARRRRERLAHDPCVGPRPASARRAHRRSLACASPPSRHVERHRRSDPAAAVLAPKRWPESGAVRRARRGESGGGERAPAGACVRRPSLRRRRDGRAASTRVPVALGLRAHVSWRQKTWAARGGGRARVGGAAPRARRRLCRPEALSPAAWRRRRWRAAGSHRLQLFPPVSRARRRAPGIGGSGDEARVGGAGRARAPAAHAQAAVHARDARRLFLALLPVGQASGAGRRTALLRAASRRGARAPPVPRAPPVRRWSGRSRRRDRRGDRRAGGAETRLVAEARSSPLRPRGLSIPTLRSWG